MSDWWTYRPSDFVMVSPRTYGRLMERHNLAAWPLQLALIALGLLLLVAAARGGVRARRAVMAVVALAWLVVGACFHAGRYAEIHTAANAFGLLFAAQALLLAGAAAASAVAGRPSPAGAVLMALALLGYPALSLATGRGLAQGEVFAWMPDPTVLFTLGLLAGPADPRAAQGWRRLLRRACWLIPVGWSVGSGLALWSLQAPEAALLPASAVVALAAAGWAARDARGPRRRQNT